MNQRLNSIIFLNESYNLIVSLNVNESFFTIVSDTVNESIYDYSIMTLK